jgi:uncharacterized RDD family membrane protein YckC
MSGLTPGDPLGEPPDSARQPAAPERPEGAPPRAAPERPVPPPGYTGPVPPGAGGPPPGYTGPVPPGAGGPPPAAVAARPVDRPLLAGWWPRVGAQLIDGAIILVGAAALLVLITAPFSVGFFASDEAGVVSVIVGALLALVCAAVVALLYAPALMARTNGKTLGRMATGIRVIRTDGRRISFGFAFLREVLVKTLLFGTIGAATGGIAQLVDVLWPLWDEENRALHDFLVNTRTILD